MELTLPYGQGLRAITYLPLFAVSVGIVKVEYAARNDTGYLSTRFARYLG